MNRVGRAALLVLSLALTLGGCQQASVPENPVTPPVLPAPPNPLPAGPVVSGTLPGWNTGEAFVTLPGAGASFSVIFDSGSDEVSFGDIEVRPPLYQASVAADGTFSVTLSEPDPSELVPLGCTADGPDIAAVGLAVASTVTTPTVGDEVIGVYTYADFGSVQRQRRALWLYVLEPYKAEETCIPAGDDEAGTTRINLALEAGWNEVIGTVDGSGTLLTSEPIPDTFEWVDEFAPEEEPMAAPKLLSIETEFHHPNHALEFSHERSVFNGR